MYWLYEGQIESSYKCPCNIFKVKLTRDQLMEETMDREDFNFSLKFNSDTCVGAFNDSTEN